MADLAIGLMSGTSADGISAVLAAFVPGGFDIVKTHSKKYPKSVREKIQAGSSLPANEISPLNVQVGELFARASIELLQKARIDPKNIFCIGSHGQTIYHGPHDRTPNTLQIGDPSVIAERTGITTVSHFRERDLAVGGEGAPLIPFFDQYFFGAGSVRALQNIGGISNVTVVGLGIKPLAFDTGPGNCLMDAAVRIITHGRKNCDQGGNLAKRGNVMPQVLTKMGRLDYFKKTPPKSTGLETFNEQFVKNYFGSSLTRTPSDVLATLNQFTAVTIFESYRRFIFRKYPVTEVVVSGGGVKNKSLMKNLELLFAPVPVNSIESLGVPAQMKEPLAFAFFALRRLKGEINHLPQGTGARKALSLGSITPRA